MSMSTILRRITLAALFVSLCFADGWAMGPPGGGGPPGQGGGGGGGGGGGKKDDPKARQSRPIKCGTSGGSVVMLSNGFCCSGTLGALVEDGSGNQYILSATHVLAGDLVAGGNGTASGPGDPVNQPGYVDVQCQDIAGDYVATLFDWEPVNVASGFVDAAIALSNGPDAVDPSGAILGIGTIAAQTVEAAINQRVKKSGRTSGVTKGTVAATNVTVTVLYEDECAGASLPFATEYTGQIIIQPGSFLQGGDSGSLMVENKKNDPRAVGLLYAGSPLFAVANPINDVLSAFSVPVTMVGSGVAGASSSSPENGSAPAGAAQALRAQERNAARLMEVPGAVGHGIGQSSSVPGRAVVLVLVERITPEAQRALPTEVNGVPVELLEVGQIVAY